MKLYHATHKNLLPKILKEGLNPNKRGVIYVSRTAGGALFQAKDDPPIEAWKSQGITFEGFSPQKSDMAVLELSGLTKKDLVLSDPEQWESDEDVAIRKVISPDKIRVMNTKRIKER